MNKHTWMLVPALAVILALFLALKSCDNRKVKDITNEHLQPGESTAIIVSPDTGEVKVVTEPNGNGDGIRPPLLRRWFSKPPQVPGEPVQSVDGARGIRIGITPGGKVVITARTKGLIFEPGPAITFSDRPRVGLDVQWAFVRRWGINSGIVAGKDWSTRGYIAGSYKYQNRYFNNTEILVGIDTDKRFLIGTKVRF